MLLSVFEKYIFLQSLGWGIANSLWQAALLWAFYQLATNNNKKLSALFKYHFSLLLLFVSFAWFVSTVAQNFTVIRQSGTAANTFGWLTVSKNITDSLQWLSIIYFLVLAFHIFQFAKKLSSVFALKNNNLAKAPVDIRLFTEQTAFHIGIKKKVGIWLSTKANVPSVIGFFKPVILLPVAALNQLTTEQSEAVILHELAHIKRNDYIVHFIQYIIETILFFNPFVKLLGNAARKERENCCDDWVVNYQYNRHDYAAALLVLERNRHASIQFALAATSGKKLLLARVKRLFAGEQETSFTISQKIKLLTVACIAVFVMLLVLPVAEQSNEPVKTGTAGNRIPFVIPIAYTYNETEGQPIAANKLVTKNENGKKAPAGTAGYRKKEVAAVQNPIEEIEYNTTLINEELLQQDKAIELENLAMQVAGKEAVQTEKLIVQIEEVQSGSKDKNTYLVELNNNNGQREVKPLIILSKKTKPVLAKAKKKPSATVKATNRKVSA